MKLYMFRTVRLSIIRS